MVSHGAKRRWNTGEERSTGGPHGAFLSVTRLGRPSHVCGVVRPDSLVPEATTQNRQARLGDDLGTDTKIVSPIRAAGTRRNHDIVDRKRANFPPARLVVTQDQRLLLIRLGQIVNQVPCEGIVVVYNERLHVSLRLPTRLSTNQQVDRPTDRISFFRGSP